MNSSTWIIIGESFLILVSLVIGMGVYAWQKKRRLLAALNVLLSNVREAGPARKKSLIGRLKKTYPINDAKAEQLSDEIFHSERQFIKQLIQLLLGSRIDEIARFNEEVYKLSTPYWELLPLDLGTADPPKGQIENSKDIPATPSTQKSDDQDPAVSISITGEEDSRAETTLAEAMPDTEIENADVASSNQTADQSIPEQDQSDTGPSEKTNDSTPATLAEENAEEPSWDDAFEQAAQEPGANEVNQERDDNGGDGAKKIPKSEAAS